MYETLLFPLRSMNIFVWLCLNPLFLYHRSVLYICIVAQWSVVHSLYLVIFRVTPSIPSIFRSLLFADAVIRHLFIVCDLRFCFAFFVSIPLWTHDETQRVLEERETRSRQENALSICSLISPPRSNVRLFRVIFLIIIAMILFFVNVIVVLQHSLSPIFPCCRTRRRRKGDEFRST